MDASKVRNLRWVPVTDWTGLPKTTWQKEECGGRYDYYVSECDINSFVDNIFRDVARKLDVSYEKVEPILREENKAFEETKGRIFLKYNRVAENDESLKRLEKMLRIPEAATANNIERILNDFILLTDIEKLEVLQRLGLTCIKIECLSSEKK